MSRWGKPYRDQRNWKEYSEEMVIRGTFFFDLDFVGKWDMELKRMNDGKRGSPFLFPESFMRFMMLWKQYLDYRGLEGMARSLKKMHIIPEYGDYTTIWYPSMISNLAWIYPVWNMPRLVPMAPG